MMLYLFVTFLTLYAFLFTVKNPLQFHVKYFTYVIITMAFAAITIPASLIRPNNLKNVIWISSSLRFIYRKIFGIDVDIENKSFLTSDKPFIIIANHQSSIDFMLMMHCWPPTGNCTPLAKKEIIYAGPFGLACWLSGVVFIDRLNSSKARDTIEKLAERINRENISIWVFPEGTRNSTKELLPFKKGAFHLAIQAQVPLLPIVISSYSSFYDKRNKKFNTGNVKVKVLEPIQTTGLSTEDATRLSAEAHDLMQREFDKLNNDVLSKPIDSNNNRSTLKTE